MKYFEDAVALVEYTDDQIDEIEKLYRASLEKKELDSNLLIKYKNLLENLRSSLDYCAHGLCEKYGNGPKHDAYFPYASLDTTKEQFLKRVEKNIPGLCKNRPDLVTFLESMQHFSRKGAEWFPQFMHLTNKNKHVRLTPSSKVDGVRLNVGGLTLMASGITIGESGSIVTEAGTVLGGQKIVPGIPVNTTGGLEARVDKWTAFLLEGVSTHMDALEFIKHSQQALSEVVRMLARA